MIRFELPISRIAKPFPGDARIRAYTVPVSVEDDGTVRAWDTVAGHYTLLHDLTYEERDEARRLAEQVRSGTHYVAGGQVLPTRKET